MRPRKTMIIPQKMTLAEMRDRGVRGLLIYCSNYKCGHLITMSGDHWPDDVRLSDLELWFICSGCGKRGAEVQSDLVGIERPSVAGRTSLILVKAAFGRF